MARMAENYELSNVGGRRSRDEEHESRSGSDNMDGASGDDQDAADKPPRKKRYHRHTPQQIQELEAYGLFSRKPLFSFTRPLLFFLHELLYCLLSHLVVFDVSFSLFKECPHPDEKQRLELSKRLCLETRQVKFWFQNRRTQMKVRKKIHGSRLFPF